MRLLDDVADQLALVVVQLQALDANPVRRSLRTADVRGETAAVACAIETAIDGSWAIAIDLSDRRRRLDEPARRVFTTRASRRAAAAFLAGDDQHEGAQELLSRAESLAVEAEVMVDGLTYRWGAAREMVASAREMFTVALEGASRAGISPGAGSRRVLADLDRLRVGLARDPCSVSELEIANVLASVAERRALVEAAQAERAGVRERVVEVDRLVRDVRTSIEERRRAIHVVAQRVKLTSDLEARVDALSPRWEQARTELSRVLEVAENDWLATGRRLTAIEASLAGLATDAQACFDGAVAAEVQRDRLKGRLEAYQMRALRLGRVEDPVVIGLHRQVTAALGARPSDTEVVEHLIHEYMRVVDLPTGGGP